MLKDRISLYEKVEAWRESKVITYVTGDRPQMETQIHPEVLDHFVHHLDLIGPVKKISLFLYTRGGNTLAAWSLVNLLRQFCDFLEIIVPMKALSAGTLMCLGADTIMMTKQATLGPIDPSVLGPLNPPVPGNPAARAPVSVEAINGFVEFARELVKEDPAALGVALQQLSTQVHPLVLGGAWRSRAQIRMLARRLVGRQLTDNEQIERVLKFLCSESGSHDYTIYRREAANELGLRIEKPTKEGYELVKALYDDVAAELELTSPIDPSVALGTSLTADYSFRRILVESIAGGCHVFMTKGRFVKQQPPQIQVPAGLPPQLAAQFLQQQGAGQQEVIADERLFEGWKHEANA